MIDVLTRAAAARDSLSNLVASLNSGKDKAAQDRFFTYDLLRDQVEAMYRGDWLARKIVDIVPYDTMREWREALNWAQTTQIYAGLKQKCQLDRSILQAEVRSTFSATAEVGM